MLYNKSNQPPFHVLVTSVKSLAFLISRQSEDKRVKELGENL